MKPIMEIFSQGEEVVCGQIVDSNAAWLSSQLTELGFSVSRHTAVGDNLGVLVALIREIAERADCCVCTGGLGPTLDDLTTQAVGMAAGLPLRLDANALRRIEGYFASRQQSMPEANRKQAYLPEGASIIENALGTAPGYILRIRRCLFVFLPGVPMEMRGMFNSLVRERLLHSFELSPDSLVTLRTVGIGESAIQQKLTDLRLPSGVLLGFRAAVDEVQTKLLFPAGFPETDRRACVKQTAALIGDYVFAIDGLDGLQGDLRQVIDRWMREKNYSLSVLETFTQGALAAKCLGAGWLKSVDICLDATQVLEKTSICDDACDPQGYVTQVAEQLYKNKQTDLVLVQLYREAENPVHGEPPTIVLYNAVYTPQDVSFTSHAIAGTPQQKQTRASILALDLLRRYLQNKCL